MSESLLYNTILPILFFIGLPVLVLLLRDNCTDIKHLFLSVFSRLFTKNSLNYLAQLCLILLSGMYLLAVLPFEASDYDFDYYDALRFISIVIVSYHFIKYKKIITDPRLFGLVAILVLFNPFVVPELPRSTWVPLDIAASFYLFYLFSLTKRRL